MDLNIKDITNMAVVIPCYNEELTIGKVIDDFRTYLPKADIYVINNRSTDKTAEIAGKKGAIVINEKRQGKGFTIISMFELIKADYYVLVDGDDTYPAESVYELLKPIVNEEADMVVGTRLQEYKEKSFRPLHIMGNKIVIFLINKIFSSNLRDIMSGYRAFNNKIVSHLPIVAGGFDIETEMTLQCLYYNYVIEEVGIPYRPRPEGSYSKLHTIQDGFLVLLKILNLFKAYKPLTFFGLIGIAAFLLSLIFGSFPIYEYFKYKFIKRVPLAILATGLSLVGMVCFAIGIILHTINFRLKELHSIFKRMKR